MQITQVYKGRNLYNDLNVLNQEDHVGLARLSSFLVNNIKCWSKRQFQNLSSVLSDKSTFLHAGLSKLNASSVKIIPNVFTLYGDYRLGFWVYIPVLSNLISHSMQGKSIHLLSRTQESGDFNLNTLVETVTVDSEGVDPFSREKLPCACNPSVRLLVSSTGNAQLVVYISSLDGIVTVYSPTLPLARWLKCSLTLKIQQHKDESPPISPTTGSLSSTPKSDALKPQNDNCFIDLDILSVGTVRTDCRLPRSSSHQNIIIGNVPTLLDIDVKDNYRCGELDAQQLNGLMVADITWSCNPNLSLSNNVAIDDLNDDVESQSRLIPPSLHSEKIRYILKISSNVLDYFAQVIDVTVSGITTLTSVTDLALFVSVLGNEEQLSKCFKIIHNVLSKRGLGQSSIAGGSGLNAAVAAKTMSTFSFLVNTVFSLFNQVTSPNVDLFSSLRSYREEDLLSIWSLRLAIQRTGVSKSLNLGKWSGLLDIVNENSVLAGFGSILSLPESKQQIDSDWSLSTSSKTGVDNPLCILYCEGGWPVGFYTGAIVDLPLNTPFYRLQLQQKLQNLPVPGKQAFITNAFVKISSQELPVTSRSTVAVPGIQLELLESCNFSIHKGGEEKKFVVPSRYSTVQCGTTEIVQVQDPFPYGERFVVDSMMKIPPVNDLLHYLHGIISFKSNDYGLISVDADIKSLSSLAYQNQLVLAENFCQKTFASSQAMMHIRALLVQLERADFSSDSNMDELLSNIFDVHLPVLLPLAGKDPVTIITSVFESVSSKSAQLDVLKNLLKEDDIFFLEKLVLRKWRQLHLSRMNNVFLSSSQHISVHPYVSPLDGEVSIVENKIKAVSHFPSLRLNDVSLQRMSGRWFYEVTILTNGLMQIGWADSHFRCDPGCGQGVGDHLHSWAFDGCFFFFILVLI